MQETGFSDAGLQQTALSVKEDHGKNKLLTN